MWSPCGGFAAAEQVSGGFAAEQENSRAVEQETQQHYAHLRSPVHLIHCSAFSIITLGGFSAPAKGA
jgi:hypothetical protein